MDNPLPLQGLRVLDLTGVWAGPYATRQFADWGAEVIRVEPLNVFQPLTRGALARPSKEVLLAGRHHTMAAPNWEPGDRPWNRMPQFNSHARNKLSMTLNLRRREGKEIFDKLVALSDILIENNVPETIDKLGLDYEGIRTINPGLIMVRMPAYGLNGPYSPYRSLGTHMECVNGHMSLRGYPELDPSFQGDVFTADSSGGIMAAFATLLALRHRRRTGQGQLVEMATSEAFIPLLGQAVMDYTMNGRTQKSYGNRHPYKVPHGCYPCQGDDRWIVLAVGSDEEFTRLSNLMGQFGAYSGYACLTENPLFNDSLSRHANQDTLDQIITAWTRRFDSIELGHILQEHGITGGAVTNEADLYSDPHLATRHHFHSLTGEELGTHFYPGPLWETNKAPNILKSAPCRLGEHNEYVYRELLGLSQVEIDILKDNGHISMDYDPDVN